MTITIDLPEAAAQRLADKAAQDGQTLDGYVRQIAVREADTPAVPAPQNPRAVAQALRMAASPADKAAALMRWIGSHDRRAPALPAAAVSREAIYGAEVPQAKDPQADSEHTP